MSRNINICVNKQLFQAVEGFENIDISNIHSIVNYSTNVILVDNLNDLTTDSLSNVFGSILQKIAVGGQLVIKFIDAKLLAQQYAENTIDDKTFITNISSVKQVLNVDNIYNYLDANFIVSKIDQSNFNTMIKIMRTNIS